MFLWYYEGDFCIWVHSQTHIALWRWANLSFTFLLLLQSWVRRGGGVLWFSFNINFICSSQSSPNLKSCRNNNGEHQKTPNTKMKDVNKKNAKGDLDTARNKTNRNINILSIHLVSSQHTNLKIKTKPSCLLIIFCKCMEFTAQLDSTQIQLWILFFLYKYQFMDM